MAHLYDGVERVGAVLDVVPDRVHVQHHQARVHTVRHYNHPVHNIAQEVPHTLENRNRHLWAVRLAYRAQAGSPGGTTHPPSPELTAKREGVARGDDNVVYKRIFHYVRACSTRRGGVHIMCSSVRRRWYVRHVHTRAQDHPDARDGHEASEHGDDRILHQTASDPSRAFAWTRVTAHLREIALSRAVPLGLAADEHGLDKTLVGHIKESVECALPKWSNIDGVHTHLYLVESGLAIAEHVGGVGEGAHVHHAGDQVADHHPALHVNHKPDVRDAWIGVGHTPTHLPLHGTIVAMRLHTLPRTHTGQCP